MKKIILVFMSCCVSMTFLCGCSRYLDHGGRVGVKIVGIGDVFQDDNGTFCLEEVAYAQSIESENAVYEDNDGGYLIVKMQFDFAKYQLKRCGVEIYDMSHERTYGDYCYRVNYFKTKIGSYDCSIKEDGDMYLGLLGTNMHINEEADEVRGKVYACFKLSTEIGEYLLDIKDNKYDFSELGLVGKDISIDLNDIRYPNTTYTIQTVIGCSFSELKFYETYRV